MEKIAGPFMGTEANGTVAGEYGRLRREMKGDAWLYGTVTMKEFVGEKSRITVISLLFRKGIM